MIASKEEILLFGNEELFEKGNLDIVSDLFTSNYIVHSGGKNYVGPKFIKQFITQLRKAILDIKVLEVHFHLQTESTISWQRTLRGTHQANMMGIPKTGQIVEWTEMIVSRFDGNKIAEEWNVSELLGQLLSKSPIE